MSDENITASNSGDYRRNPQLSYLRTKTRVKFKGSCLKQDKIANTHRKIVNIYIVYEISNSSNNNNNYRTLKNCSFVSLTKNVYMDKCKFSEYGIRFDGHGSYSHPSGWTGRNLIILEVDMNSSTKIDNKKKDILILGMDPTQGLEHALSTEKMYSFNFTENKNFYFSLHNNGANSYLFVNGTEINKFKAKDSEIVETPLYLGSISKDWSVDNLKKTGLNGYLYDFSVAYDATVVDDILDIYKYLIKKWYDIKMFGFIKKMFVIAMTFLVVVY